MPDGRSRQICAPLSERKSSSGGSATPTTPYALFLLSFLCAAERADASTSVRSLFYIMPTQALREPWTIS